jgi:hypothetical protein
MHKITFISTIHNEIGKCNADELYNIIEKLSPEVIFLEALDETYSNYEKYIFSNYGVYHKKLEISAIQKYSLDTCFEYVPVLDKELPDSFNKKYNLIGKNIEFQKLVDNSKFLSSEHGFQFLNSTENIKLQGEMRMFETRLLNDNELNKMVDEDIDTYENSMMRNIYSYCRNNQFNTAIFMCGAAHRKSIIEKMGKFNAQEKMNLNWVVFES